MATFDLNINGTNQQVDVDPDTPILWVLRDSLKMVGTKYGCGIGQCGSCTIHVDGSAIRSCSLPVGSVGNKKITTIEGLATDRGLNAVQEAWLEEDVAQCGYCQAGQIMSAAALLKENKNPDDAQIESAMAGNICRCGTYVRIKKAVRSAAGKMG